MVSELENAYILYISDVHIGDKGGSFHEKAHCYYAGCSGNSLSSRMFPIFRRFAAGSLRWKWRKYGGTSASYSSTSTSTSSTGRQSQDRCCDLQV